MYLGGFIFKIKQILKEKITLLILIIFVFGAGFFLGWWLSSPLSFLPQNSVNPSSTPKINNLDESSKVVISRNTILQGRVEDISLNSITIVSSGESLTVPLKTGALVNIITTQNQNPPASTAAPIKVTAGKISDVQIGSRVNVDMQATQPNIKDLIGISITVLPNTAF